MDDAFKAEHSAEMKKLTGLENPNSISQLKAWLVARGIQAQSLDTSFVSSSLEIHTSTY